MDTDNQGLDQPTRQSRGYLTSLVKDYRVRVLLVLLLTVFLMGGWTYANRYQETTDNATVQCDMIDVVSELNGVISDLKFEDDELVSKGQTVVVLEDEFFQAKLDRAKAELNSAKVAYQSALENQSLMVIELQGNIGKLTAGLMEASAAAESVDLEIEEAKANLEAALVRLKYLKQDYERYSFLYEKNSVSRRVYEDASQEYEFSLANKRSLTERIAVLKSHRNVEDSKVARAQKELEIASESQAGLLERAKSEVRRAQSLVDMEKANLDLAALDVSRTRIVARRSGYITNRRVSAGNFVDIGQPIASIVSCQEKAWIKANFKEMQIGDMKTGQQVRVEIDAYPGVEFSGVVESISGGSGSTFSVLPPENATGNFTKVVQRFPVRIALESRQDKTLRIGMSSIVTVTLN